MEGHETFHYKNYKKKNKQQNKQKQKLHGRKPISKFKST